MSDDLTQNYLFSQLWLKGWTVFEEGREYMLSGGAGATLLRLLGAVVQDFIGSPHQFQVREGKRYGYYRQ